LPDVLLAWLAGLLGSVLALPLAESDASLSEQPLRFVIAALLLQNLAIVGALVLITERKGQRSLARDFGLVWPIDRMRAGAVAGWVAAGAGLSLVAAALVQPIAELADIDETAQEVSKTVENANGVGLVLLLVSVSLVAPIVEELLFRGALLRALQRRFAAPVAVFASAVIFAGVHVMGDTSSYPVVPGLLLLGLVSGYQALKSGDLSRSVLLHVGFNVLSAISLALT
jgi:membrane protease YdiL (CAAX protease family)